MLFRRHFWGFLPFFFLIYMSLFFYIYWLLCDSPGILLFFLLYIYPFCCCCSFLHSSWCCLEVSDVVCWLLRGSFVSVRPRVFSFYIGIDPLNFLSFTIFLFIKRCHEFWISVIYTGTVFFFSNWWMQQANQQLLLIQTPRRRWRLILFCRSLLLKFRIFTFLPTFFLCALFYNRTRRAEYTTNS